MITILKQDFDKQQSLNILKSDINKYLVDKNEIRGYPNRMWFKGSRYR